MSPKGYSVLVIASTITLSAISRVASAQLVGCDAVGCPSGNYPTPQCVLGNMTASGIGVATLNTTISSQPLTWTIGIQEVEDPTNKSQSFYDRDFFLGTPPSLELNGSNPYEGCALLFEGVSTNLNFHVSHSEGPGYDVGVCSDALNLDCVNDLLSQAKSQLATLVESKQNVSSTCVALQVALRDSAPQTCNVAHNGTWGSVIARVITGPDASPKIQQSDCHPTTGGGYDLSLVESYRRVVSTHLYTLVEPIVFGISPVMTIFYSDSSELVLSGSLKEPEVQLTCMKVVESDGPNLASGVSGVSPRRVAMFVSIAVFVVLMFY